MKSTLSFYRKRFTGHDITPDGWEGLRTLALEHGVSISELVELIGRRELTLCPSEKEERVS